MTLTHIITIIIILSLIAIIAFITYIARKQVDFKLEDDGVDELSELDLAYDNLIETMYQNGIISDEDKRELKK